MDYTILYMLLGILVAVGVTFATVKFRESGKLKQEDLLMAMQLLNISMRVVSELRLDKEKEILTISELVIDGLEYAITNFDDTQDILVNAYTFALEIAESFSVSLSEQQKDLLRDLIVIVFNQTYKPSIV